MVAQCSGAGGGLGGDRNEDKEDTSEISVVLYKLNSIEMLMLGQIQKRLNG